MQSSHKKVKNLKTLKLKSYKHIECLLSIQIKQNVLKIAFRPRPPFWNLLTLSKERRRGANGKSCFVIGYFLAALDFLIGKINRLIQLSEAPHSIPWTDPLPKGKSFSLCDLRVSEVRKRLKA